MYLGEFQCKLNHIEIKEKTLFNNVLSVGVHLRHLGPCFRFKINIYPEFNSKFDDVVFEVFKKVSSPKCDFLTLSVDVLPGVILVSINTRGNLVIA